MIVGVTTDELCYKRKNKYPIIFQEDMDKLSAVKKYHTDVVFVGSDWKGTDAWIQYEKEFAEGGCTVVYLKHTDGISSTILRDRLNKGEEAS